MLYKFARFLNSIGSTGIHEWCNSAGDNFAISRRCSILGSSNAQHIVSAGGARGAGDTAPVVECVYVCLK